MFVFAGMQWCRQGPTPRQKKKQEKREKREKDKKKTQKEKKEINYLYVIDAI